MHARAGTPSKGVDQGFAVLSTLISGFVVFGGIGWLLDRWWGTHLMTPIGLVVGMSLGIYAVVMQFGRQTLADPHPTAARTSSDAAAALRAEKAANRARAVSKASTMTSPTDGPPPASTRRET